MVTCCLDGCMVFGELLGRVRFIPLAFRMLPRLFLAKICMVKSRDNIRNAKGICVQLRYTAAYSRHMRISKAVLLELFVKFSRRAPWL